MAYSAVQKIVLRANFESGGSKNEVFRHVLVSQERPAAVYYGYGWGRHAQLGGRRRAPGSHWMGRYGEKLVKNVTEGGIFSKESSTVICK